MTKKIENRIETFRDLDDIQQNHSSCAPTSIASCLCLSSFSLRCFTVRAHPRTTPPYTKNPLLINRLIEVSGRWLVVVLLLSIRSSLHVEVLNEVGNIIVVVVITSYLPLLALLDGLVRLSQLP